jgi:hypothetical protein
MFRKSLTTLSSACQEIVSNQYGCQYLFYTIIFSLFAFLLLQYWQMLNQPPMLGYSESSIAGIPVQLWMPDHLLVGNENQQEFQLIVDDLKIPEYSQMIITIDSPDGNAGFSRNFFIFIPGSSHDETNKAVVFYKSGLPPAESFVVRATFKIGNEQRVISRTIQVESFSNNILALMLVALAGLLALLNLINYIGSLLKKRNAMICIK